MNITVYLGANEGKDATLKMAVRDWREWQPPDLRRFQIRPHGRTGGERVAGRWRSHRGGATVFH